MQDWNLADQIAGLENARVNGTGQESVETGKESTVELGFEMRRQDSETQVACRRRKYAEVGGKRSVVETAVSRRDDARWNGRKMRTTEAEVDQKTDSRSSVTNSQLLIGMTVAKITSGQRRGQDITFGGEGGVEPHGERGSASLYRFGVDPQRGSMGKSPRWRVRGKAPPLKLKALYCATGDSQIPKFSDFRTPTFPGSLIWTVSSP